MSDEQRAVIDAMVRYEEDRNRYKKLFLEAADTIDEFEKALYKLLDDVVDLQAAVCGYGTRDGDGRSCDCKFANPYGRNSSEVTGCAEYRTVARHIRAKIKELGDVLTNILENRND